MLKSKNPAFLLITILSSLPFKYKFKIISLLFLMLVGGVIEFATIGFLFPFLQKVSGSTNQFKNTNNVSFFNTNILENIHLTNLGILILIFIISATLLKLYIIWKSNLISASIGNKLGSDAFNGILLKDYQNYLLLDTSKLLTTISVQVTKTTGTIEVVLRSICALFLLIFVFISLISLYPKLTILISFILAFIYFSISTFTKSKLRKSSYIVTNEQKKSIKFVKESIVGFREIKLNNSEGFFLKEYKKSDKKFRQSNAFSSFLDVFPKYTIEGIITVTIISIAIIIPISSDSKLIASLGVFAFASQRLLPSLQQIYSGWARLNNTQSELENIFNLLFRDNLISNNKKLRYFHSKEEENKKFCFSQIKLDNVGYRYPNSKKNVISNVDLIIEAGDIMGLQGISGSGKTTLVDIIVGLLEPTNGQILVDGESIIRSRNPLLKEKWIKNISYVPQNIFISDQPIYKNVAFGIPDDFIDMRRVKKCLDMAQLSNFIDDSLPILKDKSIGDDGIRLSGGQRQRLGIARALYRRSNLLILDEGTSALDINTENQIVKLISNLRNKLTIIMVAHRTSTLNICNKIYDLSDGNLKKVK